MATRMQDSAWQKAILKACESLPGLCADGLIKMAHMCKDGPNKNTEVAATAYRMALHRLLASPCPKFDQVAHVGHSACSGWHRLLAWLTSWLHCYLEAATAMIVFNLMYCCQDVRHAQHAIMVDAGHPDLLQPPAMAPRQHVSLYLC